MQQISKIIFKKFFTFNLFFIFAENVYNHIITVLFLGKNERDFKNLPSGRNAKIQYQKYLL